MFAGNSCRCAQWWKSMSSPLTSTHESSTTQFTIVFFPSRCHRPLVKIHVWPLNNVCACWRAASLINWRAHRKVTMLCACLLLLAMLLTMLFVFVFRQIWTTIVFECWRAIGCHVQCIGWLYARCWQAKEREKRGLFHSALLFPCCFQLDFYWIYRKRRNANATTLNRPAATPPTLKRNKNPKKYVIFNTDTILLFYLHADTYINIIFT